MTPDKFDKSLAANIRAWRLDRGYTQQQLADHLSLSRISVVNMESARHFPSIRQIFEICHFLGVRFQTIVPMEQYTPKKKRHRGNKII